MDVGREVWAHMSGEGVSARSCESEPGFEDAADSGRMMGLNSCALAFKMRGEDSGDAGRLAANWAWAMVGEGPGDSLRAVIYEVACCEDARGDTSGVCGRRKTMASGELGAELGVSGRAMRRAEWVDAREDGREIGRRVGVRKTKGTPSTSSR